MSVAPHFFWITSRAVGGAALVTASASLVLGLLMSMKLRIPSVRRDLRPVHEALSLCTLALVLLHGVSLLADSYLALGLTGIAIPFAGAYRPFWTGLGIGAGYGLAVLGLSHYLRDRIGAARWRRAHRLTAVFWALAIVHTLGAGSDALMWWFLIATGAFVVPAAVLLLIRWLPAPEEDRPAIVQAEH